MKKITAFALAILVGLFWFTSEGQFLIRDSTGTVVLGGGAAPSGLVLTNQSTIGWTNTGNIQSATVNATSTVKSTGIIGSGPISGNANSAIQLNNSGGNTGYIEWWKTTGPTRLGFMGFSTTDVPLNLENSAAFKVLGGNQQNSGTITATNGFIEQVYTTTVDFTATSTNSIILINGATKTVTLPTAVGAVGKTYVVKLIAASTGTIATTSSQNIDGATTASLGSQYESIKVVSDGTQWWKVSNF